MKTLHLLFDICDVHATHHGLGNPGHSRGHFALFGLKILRQFIITIIIQINIL